MLALCLTPGLVSADDTLRAGFAVRPLPTPDGGPLAGYGGLFTRHAEGQLDPPEARAFVVERSGVRIAIVALDLVIVRPDLRADVVEHTASLGLDSLTVVATHTHSGPGGYIPGWVAARLTAGAHDPEARPRLAEAAASAVSAATDALAPATLSAALGSSDRAENRYDPGGAAETALPVVVARFPTAHPPAPPIVLFGFGAHPTVLSMRNKRYSADYLFSARRLLAKRGWHSVFVPGALGDQQPRSELGPLWPDDPAAELEQAREIGEALALRVLAAAVPAPPTPDPVIATAEHVWSPPPVTLRRFCPIWWAGPLAATAARGLLAGDSRMQALRLGNATLVALPAEPTTAVGDRIRALVSEERVPFLLAHANDWRGYVVTPERFGRGGYEACLSFGGAGMADALVEGAAASLAELHSRAP